MSVRMSVRLSHSFKLLLLFCFSMESSHFGRHFSLCPSTKLFLRFFLFRPPKAQNLLPKICTNSPISQLVWQIDQRCLGLPGGFRGWPVQWNHAKCCGADPCCHGNKIWARRGDPLPYRLVYLSVQGRSQTEVPHCSWPPNRVKPILHRLHQIRYCMELSLPSFRGRLFEHQPFWLWGGGLCGTRSRVSGGR